MSGREAEALTLASRRVWTLVKKLPVEKEQDRQGGFVGRELDSGEADRGSGLAQRFVLTCEPSSGHSTPRTASARINPASLGQENIARDRFCRLPQLRDLEGLR